LIYRKLIKYNQLLAYEIKQPFYEIGSVEGIKEFSQYMKEKNGIH